MPDATVGDRSHAFAYPDVTTFCRPDESGFVVIGQRLEPDRAVLACRVLDPTNGAAAAAAKGPPGTPVTRQLAHEPLGWRPTTLLVTIRRYRCGGCGHVRRQDTSGGGGDDDPGCLGNQGIVV